MNEPPRPSNLGEILDRAVQLYRSRFLVFLGISLVPTVMVLVPFCCFFLFLAWLGSNSKSPPAEASAKLAADVFLVSIRLLALAMYAAIAALAMAALSHSVSRVYLGENITIRDAYKAVWRRGWRYFWLLILEGLIAGVAPMAVWIAVVSTSAIAAVSLQKAGLGNPDTLLGLTVVLLIVALACYFFWMLLRLSLAFPACVIEEIGAWAAIKRSRRLSNGTKGRIVVLYLLGAVLSWILSIGMVLTLAVAVALIPAARGSQWAQTVNLVLGIAAYGLGFAVQALIRPIYGIALTLFYYDQRIRIEGYDIEWMMQQAGLAPPPPGFAPAGILGLEPLGPVAPPSGAAGISAPAAPPDTVEER